MCHDSYLKIRKLYKRDKNNPLFKTGLEYFKSYARSLFDVAARKCSMSVNCICQKTPSIRQCVILIENFYEKSMKIPFFELMFIFLQKKLKERPCVKIAIFIFHFLVKKFLKKEKYLEIDEQKHSFIQRSEYEEDEYKTSTSTENSLEQQR